jgi:CBS domain containing-hemolysin-like protein
MTTLLVIIWVVLVVMLTLLIVIKPQRTKHSWFELEHRHDDDVMRREKLLGDVMALRRFVDAVLVAIVAVIAVMLWQWWGVVAMFVVLLLMAPLARLRPLSHMAARLYNSQEERLLRLVERLPLLGWLLRSDHWVPHDQRLESTDHLIHLVELAGHIVTQDQQRLIKNGLGWHNATAGSVMTLRDDIVSVPYTELLGPLVLHDLHQTGYTIFPVVKKDIDHVVGVLDIVELLQVDKTKRSQTAEKAMLTEVPTIAIDATLPVALDLLLETHSPFLIVSADDGSTAGLLTLGDILVALLGKNRGEVV